MGRVLWPLAVIVTLALGLVAAVALTGQSVAPEVESLRETVTLLKQQVSTLQARLRARESAGGVGRGVSTVSTPPGAYPGAETPATGRFAAAAASDDRRVQDSPAQGGAAAQPQGGPQAGASAARPGSSGTAVTAATVEAALDRFYRYLEVANGADGRERWQQLRELVNDLRAMGDAGAQALMQVLAASGDSEERRAAARLLGTLQVPEALPLLRDIIYRDDDLLLRRAAASGLRQLQTPDSIPVMEHLLASATEDRFVRLSAAYGLAEAGRSVGVNGLAQIFAEADADGRLRELAFRSLTALNDERPLPFMRQLVTSQADPSYRLQAIRYLTAQGDRQALATLQRVMQSPNEQASVRDAAAHAYAAISGR